MVKWKLGPTNTMSGRWRTGVCRNMIWRNIHFGLPNLCYCSGTWLELNQRDRRYFYSTSFRAFRYLGVAVVGCRSMPQRTILEHKFMILIHSIWRILSFYLSLCLSFSRVYGFSFLFDCFFFFVFLSEKVYSAIYLKTFPVKHKAVVCPSGKEQRNTQKD